MYTVNAQFVDLETKTVGRVSQTIAVIARADLFSECLAQAMRSQFATSAVVCLPDAERLKTIPSGEIRLVLLYDPPPESFEAELEMIGTTAVDVPVAMIISPGYGCPGLLSAIRDGRIQGLLPISHRLDLFMAAVDLMLKGGEHFPPALMQALERSERRPYELSPPLMPGRSEDAGFLQVARHSENYERLTQREVQILEMLCRGTQNKVIAARLNLSENTVKVHIRNIYKKMHVRNRTEAVSRFFRSEGGLAGEALPN